MLDFVDEAPDERFEGEWEEQYSGDVHEFFEGEIGMLKELIIKAESLSVSDKKVSSFIDGLLRAVLNTNTHEKVLIFTEYRATQECLAEALTTRFGPAK